MKSRAVGQTDAGKKRGSNEDAFLVDDELGLYVVSDGIGGHLAGEVASQMAVDVVARELREAREAIERAGRGEMGSADIVSLARGAVEAACREVHTAAGQEEDQAGMGCTLTLVLVFGQRAVMAHVGDCRLYRLRDGRVAQLSQDHTLARELAEEGLRPPGLVGSRYEHMLTREIGAEESVAVDTSCFDLSAGDVLLLCSDGLSQYIESEAWLAVQLGSRRRQALVTDLVSHAKEAGGDDNITAVVVWVDDHLPPAEHDDDDQAEPPTTIFRAELVAGRPEAPEAERDEPVTDVMESTPPEGAADSIDAEPDEPVTAIAVHVTTEAPAEEPTVDLQRSALTAAEQVPEAGAGSRPDRDDGEIDYEEVALDAELADELAASGEFEVSVGDPAAAAQALATALARTGLPAGALKALLAACELEDVASGQVIYRQGDSRASVYFVVSGRLARERSGCEAVELGPGECAGLTGLFGEQLARASLRALEPARVLRLAPESFWKIVRAQPAHGVVLLERLARELASRLGPID